MQPTPTRGLASALDAETCSAPLAPETVVKGPQGDLPQRLGLELGRYPFKGRIHSLSGEADMY